MTDANHNNELEIMMKKVTWIVMKGENEITRVTTKRMAEIIANEIGGYVTKYAVEG